MIKKTTLKSGLIHTYSTTSHLIRQIETGFIYDEAVDHPTASYTYEETDEYTDQYLQKQKEKLKELQEQLPDIEENVDE